MTRNTPSTSDIREGSDRYLRRFIALFEQLVSGEITEEEWELAVSRLVRHTPRAIVIHATERIKKALPEHEEKD